MGPPANEIVVKLEWNAVTPAKAGVQRQWGAKMLTFRPRISAFAGMTNEVAQAWETPRITAP